MTFFIDCDHIYVPNGANWGSTSRPHIGDLVMNLFLYWGLTFISGEGWQKTAIFSCNFDLFLIFYIDCGHIYVPNGMFWGSTGRPHIGDLVMSLFLLWGPLFMTGDGPKMVHFGPKMTKHGRFVNVTKWFERVLKGPKWST